MKQTHNRWKHCFVSFYFPSNRPIVRARVAPRRIVNITKRQLFSLTSNEIHVIGPRSSFPVSTPIGSSIPPVSQVSSSTCGAPSLMLYSKGYMTKPQGNQSTFVNGVGSSSVIIPEKNIFAVYTGNSSTSSVAPAAS